MLEKILRRSSSRLSDHFLPRSRSWSLSKFLNSLVFTNSANAAAKSAAIDQVFSDTSDFSTKRLIASLWSIAVLRSLLKSRVVFGA